MTIRDLPHVNASLNALAAILLVSGYLFIRRKNVPAHRNCMIAAFVTSIVFLVCYLTYHAARQAAEGVGHTKFAGVGAIAKIYYGMLISHVVLAVVQVPLILRTVYLGLKDRRAQHKKWAKVTTPIWLYVSITGVVIYWMLYHL